MNDWKSLFLKSIFLLRLAFLGIISADFYVSFFSSITQKAVVLSGIGSYLVPFIVPIWFIITILYGIVMIYHIFKEEKYNSIMAYIEYGILIACVILYGGLCILSLINFVSIWPIAFNYGFTMAWAGIMIYVRRITQNVLEKEPV